MLLEHHLRYVSYVTADIGDGKHFTFQILHPLDLRLCIQMPVQPIHHVADHADRSAGDGRSNCGAMKIHRDIACHHPGNGRSGAHLYYVNLQTLLPIEALLTPTSKGTFGKARTGIAATILSTLVDFSSGVFCASGVCSICAEDVPGRSSPATATPFRTTPAKIKRNEGENDLATLSAIRDSLRLFGCFRRCPAKQRILSLPSRIGFSFHGSTDIRAAGAAI